MFPHILLPDMDTLSAKEDHEKNQRPQPIPGIHHASAEKVHLRRNKQQSTWLDYIKEFVLLSSVWLEDIYVDQHFVSYPRHFIMFL